jgi:Cd2+/Zn2+-exporting ATPase
VFLDKTGTLTSGQPVLKRIVPLNGLTDADVLTLAARAEAMSEHPIAKAILNAAYSRGLDVSFNCPTQAHGGLGVEAADSGHQIAVGSRKLIERAALAIPQEVDDIEATIITEGETPLFVSRDNELVGIISIEDGLRPESPGIIKRLRTIGIGVGMLTGDAKGVASVVARRCGIPATAVNAELLPAQKQAFLRTCQDGGKRVCFVGDGTNDAPALASADIGVSIGSRKDTVALETAHVVLMRDGLEYLPHVLGLGRHTKRTISVNLFIAIAFSIAMFVLAGTGVLTPILGAIAHNAGSIIVILNSARLIRFRT